MLAPVMLVLCMNSLFAQENFVTGSVVDQDNVPLPGASVVVVGTTRGAQTNFDGIYNIQAERGETLRFSYLGMSAVEVLVGDANTIDVQLVESAEMLEEIVLVGYGSGQVKNRVASAITTLSSEALDARPNASFVQTLQGQIPGVQIAAVSGQPGANSTILVRGLTSLSGNIEPLFIMDGVPIDETNFRSLNPNDIESINVLKDGSASALYGNRGAAGVIVIKTKSASYNSKLDIRYRTQTGFTTPQDPNFEMMNTQEIIALERQTGNPLFDAMNSDQRAFLVGEGINTNWADIITLTGQSVMHEIALSAGGQNVSNYSSLSYFEQGGTVRGSNLQRFTFRSNFSVKSNDDRFDLTANFTGNFSKSNFTQGPGTGNIYNPWLVAQLAKPYLDPYNPDGSLNTVGLNRDGFDVMPYVSLNSTKLNSRNDEEIKLVGSLNGGYEIMPNLRLAGRFGLDYNQRNDLDIISPLSIRGQEIPNVGSELKGQQFEQLERDVQFNTNASLTYSNTFSEKHQVKVAGFVEFNKGILDNFGFTGFGIDPRIEGYNFAPGGLREFPGVAPGDESLDNLQQYYIPEIFSGRTEVSLFSYFGILNYDYDGVYGLDASIRQDASSRFSDTNKWGTFWSVAGRWNISREKFLADSQVVDLLKLRASYGTSGNDRITGTRYGGTTLTSNLYSVGNGYNNTQAVYASSLANPDLKWETTKQLNVGLDFGLLGRVRGTLDFYDKRTSDLFYATPNTLLSTFPIISRNIGSMKNTGVEASLDVTFVDTPDFNWSVNANAAFNKNEITELLDGELIEGGQVALQEGRPFNSFYLVRWAGVNPASGQPVYLDAEGNPTLDYNTSNRVFLDKSTLPEITGGFGTSISYKGLSLDALFTFVGDVYRQNDSYGITEDPTLIGALNTSVALKDIWQEPGDITAIPGVSAGSTRNLLTDRYLENASYLRLRNIILSYRLQQATLDRVPFSSARIYLQAENLVTWSKWRGFDPEASVLLIEEFFTYPTPRILTIGLDISF
ncbi:SusC/RagA family TonB-linked outer membrane protein [Robiginitalea sp. SC105]|uniref:SusC/RagA family TonB-linked outer membrane protein n=1 Tax=Robiginitalea sp. SC105 TaxID=2762332 RepID=UPI00163A318E|nr:SusC/RagA family TonB-linked outer membrane protein [Robiginitalea sp. SC105]MBC2838314.1 SusC/RagA family TonB-linked outer membrane protein [Robiginitalea sp. SC105]